MTNRKAIVKGTIKISFIVVVLVALGFLVFNYALPALADHTSTASLIPEWSPAGQNVDYTVTISNEGPATVDEVRIYKNTEYDDFECDEKEGWEKYFIDVLQACFYVRDPDTIPAGESDDFDFSAIVPDTGCNLQWKFETRDTASVWKTIYDNTSVDNLAPVIEKTVGQPQTGVCPPGEGDECWITQDTAISVQVTDPVGECDPPSMVDYCEFTVKVDGVFNDSWIKDAVEGEVTEEIQFDEDSVHELNITCFDNAGNKLEDIEEFKVDSGPPVTEKRFDGINKTVDGVEWIDGVTQVVLEATDPEPDHASDVDKTLYLNVLAEDYGLGETPCWNLQSCQPIFLSPPTECVLEAEDYCDQNWGEDWNSWEDCVEDFIYYQCFGGQADFKWQVYTGPFQKDEESCHLVEYYSIDNVGNTEDVKVNCFFVDKRPPVLTKEVGEPEVEMLQDNVVLSQSGDGTSQFTDDDAYVGSKSVYLTAGLIIDFPPSNEGRIRIPLQGMTLGDIDTIAWYAKVLDGYIPHVDIKVDTNGDDLDDDALVVEYDKVQPPSDQLLGDMNFATGVWVNTFDDKGIVDDSAGMWLSSGAPGPVGDPAFIYGTLAEWKAGKSGIDSSTKVVALEIEVDGWIADATSYVDFVKLNGEDVLSVHSVGPKTPITFTCTDPEPHPSDDEKVCFKVSFDKEPYDLTSLYAIKYQTVVGQDGFACVPVDTQTKQFIFNFNEEEDSMHDLEYYCKDAVEKKSETELQWYKVDSVPPVITKEIIGPQYGDCPPQPEGGKCYIQDSGTIIRVDVEDNAGAHDSGVDYCSWSYTLDGQQVGEPKYEYEFPFDIVFPEDSTHVLTIDCFDKLGNMEEDIETFLVDSNPPETTKEYGDPTKVEGSYRWITSSTPIDLTPVDVKVGTDKLYWRNTLLDIPDQDCIEACDYESLGEWNIDDIEEGDTVTIYKPEESCHLIEYYSVDLLGNTEDVKKQCVFVDKTPPIGLKEVGVPSVKCEENNNNEVFNGEPCEGDSRTYTLDADFDEGVLVGVEHETVSNQLQLILGEVSTFPVLWVANAGEDTLSKWDTNTNKELARYHTWFGPKGNHGAWSGPAPSRTAVDSDGNAYVANRHFDNKPANVFKIYTDDWVDRNGNGVMDTSFDANDDGAIVASEMIQFTDDNFNGIIDDEEITDERVAWVATVGSNSCLGRSLAIDLGGDIWLGCYGTQQYYKMDGSDGSLLAGPINVAPNTPYGALVDKYGILWGASLGDRLLKLDTNTNTVLNVYDEPGSDYGIAIGYDDEGYTQVYLGGNYPYVQYDSNTGSFTTPATYLYGTLGIAVDADGNIVAGDSSTGGVSKFAPDGSLIWTAPPQAGVGASRGTVIDSNNNIWVIDVYANKMAKFAGTDGAPLGVFNTGLGPYTYSDATGLGLKGSISSGTWNVIYDSGAADTELGPVSWSSDIPEGTSMTVRVRSSNNQVAWSPWETVSNGAAFVTTPNARYLEVEVSMKSSGDESPVLYDLTVEGGCGAEPEVPQCDYYVTQDTPITLDCNDQLPHPVDQETVYWRFSLWQNGFAGQPTYTQWYNASYEGFPIKVYFLEDSWHDLEFYCEDHLGNANEVDTEYFIVDTVPPVIGKEVVGPQTECSDYEGEGELECIQIDGVTEINVDVIDPEPHPVGGVTCDWRYFVVENESASGGAQGVIPPFVIQFLEESTHVLDIVCSDTLGNTAYDLNEVFIVDKTPPLTTKEYNGPQYPKEGYPKWITSDTNVILEATDDVGPHDSGVKATYWRNTLVDDTYCDGVNIIEDDNETNDDLLDCDDAFGSGEWNLYTVPFQKQEQSCHLIEYYSVDNVEKTEKIQRQCVFVDNSPPEPNKTVGKPRTEWDGSDAIFYDIADKCWSEDQDKFIECWKVTLFTPITLDCNDPEPHPVDNEETCFKVEMDGNDVTGKYCDYVKGNYNNTGDGFCCGKNAPFEFRFNEETEHELEYYCVDALGNRGEEIDVEKFKVEGTSFEIQLNEKWNLISVPFVMLDGSIDEVFKDINYSIKSVWSYDAETGNWSVYTPGPAPDSLSEMVPGDGYWVYANENAILLIGGSLFSPAKTPPSKAIVNGWNLIGYYGTEEQDGYFGPDGNGKTPQCALYSLGEDIWDKEFASLWTYWEPYNTDGDPDTKLWIPYGQGDNMDPGAGYWLLTSQNGEYAVTTTCGLFD